MKVLSLYDGISCGRIALERVGISVERYVAYEIDKYAIKISEMNYPDIEHKGDVFMDSYEQYNGFDLLIGGSPCTFWSIAKETRETTPDGIGGKLFMQYMKALKESKVKWFLYENNHSIHDNIKNFISEQLGVKPITINSSSVSAQDRLRCYWTNIPNVIEPQRKFKSMKDIMSIDECTEKLKRYDSNIDWLPRAFDDIKYSNCPLRIGNIGKGGQGQRIYSVNGKSITMLATGNCGLYRTLDSNGNYIVRKLSTLEMERLQTLPDNYTNCEGISNVQRQKCIGNGWTVDVIASILSNLRNENAKPICLVKTHKLW